jgi:DNA-binding NarL/FixJ family response regulator
MEETQHVVRVIVVAEHALVRSLTRRLLEGQPDCQVVGEAPDGPSAIPIAAQTAPHVVLVDTNLDGEDDIAFLPWLKDAAPEARVLLVASAKNVDLLRRAVQMGARGIVYSDAGVDSLLEAIEKVHAGEVWLDRKFTAELIELGPWREPAAPQRDRRCADGVEALTPREREVVSLVCAGHQNKVVAGQLGISDVTVRHHLTSVFAKLGVRDRVSLVVHAHRQGLGAAFR